METLFICQPLLLLNLSVLQSQLWNKALRNFSLLFHTFTFLLKTDAAYTRRFHCFLGTINRQTFLPSLPFFFKLTPPYLADYTGFLVTIISFCLLLCVNYAVFPRLLITFYWIRRHCTHSCNDDTLPNCLGSWIIHQYCGILPQTIWTSLISPLLCLCLICAPLLCILWFCVNGMSSFLYQLNTCFCQSVSSLSVVYLLHELF